MLHFLFKGKPQLRILVGAVIIGISLALGKSLLNIHNIEDVLKPATIAMVVGTFLIIQAVVELIRHKMRPPLVNSTLQQPRYAPEVQENAHLQQPSPPQQK